MLPNDLRYTLIINEVEHVLLFAPIGWDETLLNWSRSEKYYGMLRSFSAPMSFVEDGAYLIRGVFYTSTLKGDIKIRIEQFFTRVYKYTTIFEGSLDLSTFSDQLNSVEIKVMDGGFNERIKAFENIQYEISLNDLQAVSVILPGIGLIEKANAISTGQYIDWENWHPLASGAVPETAITLNNLENEYIIAQNTFFYNGNTNDILSSENWLVKALQDTTVSFSGRVKGTYRKDSQFKRIALNIGPKQIVDFPLVGENSFDVEFTINNYAISAGEKMFLRAYILQRMDEVAFDNGWLRIDELEINITNNISTPDTECLAFPARILFDRLLAKMNKGFHINSQSFLLDIEWGNLLITSGDAIRNIINPVIKTSFSDFFTSMNSLRPVSFTVENNIPTLEGIEYSMRANLDALTLLSSVKDLSIDVATDYIYNAIKIGYADEKYDKQLGREEYNMQHNYSTPITRVQKELNLMSKYRADQLGIDELRLTPPEDNTDDVDKEGDNDVFFIQGLKTESPGIYTTENIENYILVEGIEPRNAYYNLGITPKKNLLRHGSILRSMLQNYEDQHIIFESASKNTNLTTTSTDNNTVHERASVQIGRLADPIFMPLIATFTHPISHNIAYILNTKASGVITFSFDGYTYKGFIISVSTDVAKDSAREFKVLLTANNNILNLVR